MVSYTIADASGESSGYSFLTTAEIKNYLSVDGSSYDALIEDIYDAVASNIEQETAQTLKNRDITVEFDYNEKYFALPLKPVTSITSVTYIATDESSGTIAEASGDFNTYGLTGSRNGDYVLEFNQTYNKVRIVYNSDGSTVPSEFKLAVLAHIKTIFNDDRDFTGELAKIKYPEFTIRLIRKYRPLII